MNFLPRLRNCSIFVLKSPSEADRRVVPFRRNRPADRVPSREAKFQCLLIGLHAKPAGDRRQMLREEADLWYFGSLLTRPAPRPRRRRQGEGVCPTKNCVVLLIVIQQANDFSVDPRAITMLFRDRHAIFGRMREKRGRPAGCRSLFSAGGSGRKIRRICRATKVAEFGTQDIEIARAPIDIARLVG